MRFIAVWDGPFYVGYSLQRVCPEIDRRDGERL